METLHCAVQHVLCVRGREKFRVDLDHAAYNVARGSRVRGHANFSLAPIKHVQCCSAIVFFLDPTRGNPSSRSALMISMTEQVKRVVSRANQHIVGFIILAELRTLRRLCKSKREFGFFSVYRHFQTSLYLEFRIKGRKIECWKIVLSWRKMVNSCNPDVPSFFFLIWKFGTYSPWMSFLL